MHCSETHICFHKKCNFCLYEKKFTFLFINWRLNDFSSYNFWSINFWNRISLKLFPNNFISCFSYIFRSMRTEQINFREVLSIQPAIIYWNDNFFIFPYSLNIFNDGLLVFKWQQNKNLKFSNIITYDCYRMCISFFFLVWKWQNKFNLEFTIINETCLKKSWLI